MPGMEARTIIASGCSKTYAWTGGRVGWAVYPTVEEALAHRQLAINYFASIPPYNQWGAIEALESPESATSIQIMVEAFQHRRDLVVTGLNEISGITCQNPKGAFYAFPNIEGALQNMGGIKAFDELPEDIRTDSSPNYSLPAIPAVQIQSCDNGPTFLSARSVAKASTSYVYRQRMRMRN